MNTNSKPKCKLSCFAHCVGQSERIHYEHLLDCSTEMLYFICKALQLNIDLFSPTDYGIISKAFICPERSKLLQKLLARLYMP